MELNSSLIRHPPSFADEDHTPFVNQGVLEGRSRCALLHVVPTLLLDFKHVALMVEYIGLRRRLSADSIGIKLQTTNRANSFRCSL